MRILVMPAIVAGLLSSLAMAADAPTPRALALTPESVAADAAVKDDALEIDATITTEAAAPAKRGLFAARWDDNFVRAFIDKKSGVARYQVYQRLAYLGTTYREYTNVNYETLAGDGPASADLVALGRVRDCKSSGIFRACIHYEDVAFGVDEALLRRVAAWYGAGEPRPWRFRFKSQAGADADEFLMPAEVAGALLAVDRYRADHGLPR